MDSFWDLTYIYVYIVVAIGVAGAAFSLPRLLAPSNPNKIKNTPYECGEVITGAPWIQFNVAYYIFALLFVIFDVETVFLFPLAVSYKTLIKQQGIFAFVEMSIFVLVLFLGLIYAWRKGVLKWV